MSWTVLISAPYAMPVVDQYRKVLHAAGCEVVVAPVRERLSEKELMQLVSDVDGIICGDDQVTDRVLAAATRLKVISKWGTGIDSIDLQACKERGITVCNTPNAFSEPVADTVMGYVLMFARELQTMNQDIRAGRWIKPQLVSLRERTIGVIGVGNCGKAVVSRAHAFGMRILGNDPVTPEEELLATNNVEMVSKDELLKESDFVTLHPDLNPSSFHLIDDGAFALMKPTAFLINTSRGPVVREKALVSALEKRLISGAALDVFEVEPLPDNSRLREFENCWLAPHNANSSPAAARRVHDNTIKNLLDVLQAG